MISTRRIWAMVLRHLYMVGETNHIISNFYWPLLDICVWGLTSVWVQETAATNKISMAMIAGIVFWQIILRTSVEAAMALLEEVWSLNMLNIFASPLRLGEWIIAIIIIALILSVVVVIYCSILVYFFFGSTLLLMVPQLLPFLGGLFIAGLSIGFFSAALIVYFGARIQWIAWMMGWFFAPFCSALYPIHILPLWVQKITWWIPMTPLFEGIRQMLEYGTLNSHLLLQGFGLAILYCGIFLSLFFYLFQQSKQRGFARFTAD